MSILLVHSHYGEPPSGYAEAASAGRLAIVRERDLTPGDFESATGLITTTHLDQIGFLRHGDALNAMLARSGRWFFSGHILREFVHGLRRYVPLDQPRRADYALTRLHEHPIFFGIDQQAFETNRGVAGFYGRGHNPLPLGATVVNGIGPNLLPIDWDWPLPGGGRMFCHAGNDLGGMSGENGDGAVLTQRIIAWCAGEIG